MCSAGHAAQYSIIQYSTIYSTVMCSAGHAAQYSIIQYSTI